MRIVFMGTPEFAVPCLATLVDHGYDVVAVVTAPDRPGGRGLQLRPSPVKAFAQERGLNILQPEKLRDPQFLEQLQALQPDLGVVVAFRMLPEAVWRMPRLGTFNLHASLLPDYRGAAPINWAIINGETQTGLTTFLLDKEIDTGAILLQETIQIPPEWNAGHLHDHMMAHGADLVLRTTRMLDSGQYAPLPQAHRPEQHHPAPKIFRDDCRIDWMRPAKAILNQIRGLSPYPAAWTTVDGKTWKIYDAAIGPPAVHSYPGTIEAFSGRLTISCCDAWLEIKSLQVEGKARMDATAFLNGYKGGASHAE